MSEYDQYLLSLVTIGFSLGIACGVLGRIFTWFGQVIRHMLDVPQDNN